MKEKYIKLIFSRDIKQWHIDSDFYLENDLYYQEFEDAIVAVGFLGKEISRIFKLTVCILIYNRQSDLLKEVYIYPPLEMSKNANILMKKWFNI